MESKTKAQINMDDTIIDDPELEKMLEERQELKESIKAYNKLNKDVKDKLLTIEAATPYRVGRFIISRSEHPPRQVSFETQGSFSFTIKLAGEE